MINIRKAMTLYGITDQAWVKKKPLSTQVKEALSGGVTCLQLREKHMSDEDFLKEAYEIHRLTKAFGIPLIINDNLDVAIQSQSEGIHIGQDDLPLSYVRSHCGADMIIGVSVQTVEEAQIAEAEGADYLGVGAVFATQSKDDAIDVSLKTLSEITQSVNIPVVAIGGISLDNMMSLQGTGIDGVAIISALFSADDISSRARDLYDKVQLIKRPAIKGVVFDLDGTLLDSLHEWEHLGTSYLKTLDVAPEECLDEILRPMSMDEAVQYLKEHYHLSMSEKKIRQGLDDLIRTCYEAKAQLKEGVREFLEDLSSHHLSLCIATETNATLASLALERLGIRSYFKEVLSCDDHHNKQDSSIYQEACDLLHLSPQETLVIEDNASALHQARLAGCQTCGVFDETWKDQLSLQKTSDYYLFSLKEYKEVLPL